KIRARAGAELREAIERAVTLSKGTVRILAPGEAPQSFSLSRTCPRCGLALPDPDPRAFSFASKHGACPACGGSGLVHRLDPDLLLDRERSLDEGALMVYA